ncbi:hypothetical protein [Magnetofaba australis]|uniref:Uncharacterized protein n=1 Tax=Magnetofaba australis IT-1 TaxID=1434232 RepID=A0A1Y2K802_9PROT|nr:hypothetical protein [Magnetofaba australis]OSM04806.1 hypothetical protein MAIT1_02901 [Magnetofaba australis IT-1]
MLEIYFDNKTEILPEIYEPIDDDAPRLALSIHLHGWTFPDQKGQGIAKLRVEIREGSTDPKQRMIGVGFVEADADGVRNWIGYAPLSQAILDGLMSHEAVTHYMRRAAAKALELPEPPEPPKGGPRKMPAKALFNPNLHRGDSPVDHT